MAERIAEYEGEYKCEEWDVGTPKGKYENGTRIDDNENGGQDEENGGQDGENDGPEDDIE